MNEHRGGLRYRSAGAWICGGLVLGAAASIWNLMGVYDHRQDVRRRERIDGFSEAASGTIVWLQQQIRVTGKYPTSIPAEVRAPLDARERYWYFMVDTDGSNYSIGFGDYIKDGFQHYWSSERNEWMTDS